MEASFSPYAHYFFIMFMIVAIKGCVFLREFSKKL